MNTTIHPIVLHNNSTVQFELECPPYHGIHLQSGLECAGLRESKSEGW